MKTTQIASMLVLSMGVAIAAFVWAFFLPPGNAVAYGVICVLSGLALGADLALPPSMLADVIELIHRGQGKVDSKNTLMQCMDDLPGLLGFA